MLAIHFCDHLVPGSGVIACVPIFKQDNFPDFVNSQMLFPWWHNRCPGETFVRQADSALGHSPENERFLQLRDSTRIGKVCRDRIESEGMETAAIQIVAMTEVTVLVEDLSPFTDVLEVPLSILIPRISIWLHQTAHTLFHNVGVAILLIVLSFRIDTIGILRRLKCIGLSMHLGAGWRRRMYRP